MADSHQQKLNEVAAMNAIAQQAEDQRLANNWPRLIRAAVWLNVDKLFVAVATRDMETVVVSLDPDAARQLRDNIDSLLGVLESGEHKTEGGGYPPPYIPQRDN